MTAPTADGRAVPAVARPPLGRAVIAVVGVIAWVGLIWIGATLYAATPPRAGFDLELLLDAGRAVAAGRSPYDPALVAGTAPVAESLFYSYPPLVAQAMAIVAWLPSPAMLVAWGAAATAALGGVSVGLAKRFAPERSAASVAIPVVALAPVCFPFAIGLLFGNLDVFFPLLYGLMLLALTGPAGTRAEPARSSLAPTWGGTSLAVASLTKLHPASIGAWFTTRAVGRDAAARRALLVAIAVGVAVLGLSLVVGGPDPWRDYLAVIRAGSTADLVDPRNAAPAAQLALLVGGGDALARMLHVGVAAAVLVVTIAAARRIGDPVTGLAVAAVASLATLPVTWYHYPSALIPFAIAAVLRAPRARVGAVSRLVAGALVVAAVGIVALPLIWLAMALVVVAVRRSEPAPVAAGIVPAG